MMSILAKIDMEVTLPHHSDATAAIRSSRPPGESARASEYMQKRKGGACHRACFQSRGS